MFPIADAAAWPLNGDRDPELLCTDPALAPSLLPLAAAWETTPLRLFNLPTGPDGQDHPATVTTQGSAGESSEATGLDPITGLSVVAGEAEPLPAGELPSPCLPDGGASAWRIRTGWIETGWIDPSRDPSLIDAAVGEALDPVGEAGPGVEPDSPPVSLAGLAAAAADTGSDPRTGDGGTLSDTEEVAVALTPTERLAPRLITDPVPGGDLQTLDPADGGTPPETGPETGVVAVDRQPPADGVPPLTTDPVAVGDPQPVTIAEIRVHFASGEQGWASYLYSIGIDGEVVGVLVIASYDEPSIARFVKENSHSSDWWIIDRGEGWLIGNFPLDQAPPVPDQGFFSPNPDVFSQDPGDSADPENSAVVIPDPGLGDPSLSPESDPTYDAYLAFVAENPDWPEQNGADGIQLQVITASAHLPWIELATPGAAQAFDRWYEQIFRPQQLVPERGGGEGWPEPVICTFLPDPGGWMPEAEDPVPLISSRPEVVVPIEIQARGDRAVWRSSAGAAPPVLAAPDLPSPDLLTTAPESMAPESTAPQGDVAPLSAAVPQPGPGVAPISTAVADAASPTPPVAAEMDFRPDPLASRRAPGAVPPVATAPGLDVGPEPLTSGRAASAGGSAALATELLATELLATELLATELLATEPPTVRPPSTDATDATDVDVTAIAPFAVVPTSGPVSGAASPTLSAGSGDGRQASEDAQLLLEQLGLTTLHRSWLWLHGRLARTARVITGSR